MQPNRPLRPLALVPNMEQVLAAASAAGLPALQQPQGRSAFTAVPQTTQQQQALYPEIALFSQLGQLFPQTAELNPYQQAAAQLGFGLGLNQAATAQPAASRGRARSSDSKSSSAYASRHQAAEQRRRSRINERLDRLRQVVPHSDRANTACFLEEVIAYIQGLQKRIAELEGTPMPAQSQPLPGQQQPKQQILTQPGQPGLPASAAASQPELSSSVMLPAVPQQLPSGLYHPGMHVEHRQARMYDPAAQAAQLNSSQALHSVAPSTSQPVPQFPQGYLAAAAAALCQPATASAQPGTPPAGPTASGKDGSSTATPASSEDSGIPLKKRRMAAGQEGLLPAQPS